MVFVKHKPVGGVKVMYQHCLMLRGLGFEAYPLIMGDYEGNFFVYDVEVKHLKELGYELEDGDVLISPEFAPYLGLDFKGGMKVLFNQSQSWRYHENRLKLEDKGKNFLEMGYDYAITCSQHLSDMLQSKMGMLSYPITNGIDTEKFFPVPVKRISGRILTLSRKHPEEIQKIIDLASHLDFHFQVVDGLSEDELIEEYQQAEIFLATGYPEGLPLPQLEAMNCGCVVVGFTGGGGDEYMLQHETAFVADDGDCQGVLEQLTLIQNEPVLKEKVREQGFNKAAMYSYDNTRNMLKDFYQGILKLDSKL
jgi:glycosyltransferase involved in cell wall biosynthesis